MIMPRKKRRTIKAIIVMIILAIILGICLLLYTLTDMFKSNDILFNKYVGQLVENIVPMLNEENMITLKETLAENKLSLDTNVNITYSGEENTDNGINNLKMHIEGNTEKRTGYNYQNIQILQNEDVLAGIEYIQEEALSGIRLNGIKQFLSTNIQDESDNEIQLIYNLANTNFIELLKITSEELRTLEDKYVNIIIENISNASYSKQSDVVLEINEEKYNTDAYSLTITKEQFNNIYIKILQEIKQDEIILSKLEKVDNAINTFYQLIQDADTSNLRQKFIQKVEDTIEEIQSSNIGNDQRTITVYETDGRAISLAIDTEEYFISLDVLNTQENNFINFLGNEKIEENEKENSFDLKIEKTFTENNQEIKLNYNIVEEGEKTANEILINQKMEDASKISNYYTISRSVEENRLDISIENVTNVVNDFVSKEQLAENENNIIIEELTEEQEENVRSNIEDNIFTQLNNIQQVVSFESIRNMLVQVKIIEEELEKISNEEITEAERIRFNSDFEFFEGENISKERLLELLNLTKENIEDIVITQYQQQKSSNTQSNPLEYMLKINRNKEEGNLELAEEFINTITESRNNLFSVRLEYNEETGLINSVYITIQK